MKQNMTDLFDYVPVDLIEPYISEQNKATKPCHSSHTFRWAAAAALICCFLLAGSVGYAAFKYPDIFETYFTDQDQSLKNELLTAEILSTENTEYRLSVESMLLDTDVKKILVSVEALTKDSWNELIKNDYFPGIFTYWDSNAKITPMESDSDEWKEYFLFTFSGREKEFCIVSFMPASQIELLQMYNASKAEQTLNEEYLSIKIPLESQAEGSLVIYPKDCQLTEQITIDKIIIDRMNITMIANGHWDSISYQEVQADPCAVKLRLGISDPEIIIKTKDGEKICLLVDEKEEISTPVDEIKEIDPVSRNNGIYCDISEQYLTICYEFTKAFDISQIENVWVNGVAY